MTKIHLRVNTPRLGGRKGIGSRLMKQESDYIVKQPGMPFESPFALARGDIVEAELEDGTAKVTKRIKSEKAERH